MNGNRVPDHKGDKLAKRDYRILDDVEKVVLEEAREFAALANDIYSCCGGLLDNTDEKSRAEDTAKACLEAALNRATNLEEIYDIQHGIDRYGAKSSQTEQ